MPRLILLALTLLAACDRHADRHAASRALIAAQCAACHTVPGVAIARGQVGPPLAGIARRTTLAGRLPNTPANMRHFLLHPQAVHPGGAMPDMGLTPAQADAIADYLATLDEP